MDLGWRESEEGEGEPQKWKNTGYSQWKNLSPRFPFPCHTEVWQRYLKTSAQSLEEERDLGMQEPAWNARVRGV